MLNKNYSKKEWQSYTKTLPTVYLRKKIELTNWGMTAVTVLKSAAELES